MRRVLSCCGAVWRDRSGVAALEFAIVAPIMILFIVGTIEVSNAFRLQAKLNVAAGQLAELVAGQSAVTAPAGTLADICTGAAMNLSPYPVGALSANIASLSVDHPSNRKPVSTDSRTVGAYLDWENTASCATTAASPLAISGAFAIANSPNSLLTKSGVAATGTGDQNLQYKYSVIVVQVRYSYRNILPFFMGTTINFLAIAVARPRANATIPCTNTAGNTACPELQSGRS